MRLDKLLILRLYRSGCFKPLTMVALQKEYGNMIWYDSHELLLALLVVHSRTSIEEDTTCSFSIGTRESEVFC
jgi:hypothetical protein